MKRSFAAFFAIFACLVLSVAADAQPSGFREVRISRSATIAGRGCPEMAGVHDTLPVPRSRRDEACVAAARDLNVRFDRERLIHWSAAGDCRLSVRAKAFLSDREKQLLVVLNTIYGGCRAAGDRAGWLVVEKPPPGYGILVSEVKVDRENGLNGHTAGFQFPKPPPTIEAEDVDLIPVDINGCLTLSGRSQWVISNELVLETSVAGREDAERCREHFRSLKIDFRTHTLAGASFASGHCGRPEGLVVTARRETSSDGSRDRVLLQIRYYDAGLARCGTWTTFPVWVLMPKIGSGYRLEVDADAR